MDIKDKEKNKFPKQDHGNGHNGVELQETFMFITPKVNKSDRNQHNDIEKGKHEKSDSSDYYNSSGESDSDDDFILKTPKVKKSTKNHQNDAKNNEKDDSEREKSRQFLNKVKIDIDTGKCEKKDISDSSSESDESDSDDECCKSSEKNSKLLFCCYDVNLALDNPQDPNEREKFKKNLNNYRLRNRILKLIVTFLILCTFVALGYYIKNYRYKYKFLTEFDRKIVHEYPVRYANLEVRFQDLFPVGSNGYHNMDWDLIKSVIRREINVNLDDKKYENLRKFVALKWGTLGDTFRDKVLTSNCSFQGETLRFDELYKEYPEAFEMMSNSEIIKVLHNKSVGIGKMVQNSEKFYIERNFIKQNLVKNDENHEFNGNASNIDPSVNLENIIKSQTESSLKFTESDNFDQNPKSINFDEMIQNTQNHKLIIMSDKPGSGKSTTFKKIALNLKQKFPNYWISYIEVRNFMKFMNRSGKIGKIENFLENIFDYSYYSAELLQSSDSKIDSYFHSDDAFGNDSGAEGFEGSYSQKKISKRGLGNPEDFENDEIASKFVQKLYNFTKIIPSNFEKEILKQAYRNNKTVILWDGIDAISPTYSQFMMNVIKEISLNTENLQFVSTTPKNLNNFINLIDFSAHQTEFDVLIYRFSQFNVSDQEELMKNHLNLRNLSFQLKASELMNLEHINSDVVDLNSPLMLQMLADVVSNENSNLNHAKTSNFSSLKSVNLYEFFDKFFQVKINKWAEIINLKDLRNSNKSQLNLINQNFHKNSSIQDSISNILQIFAFKYEMSILSSPIHLKIPNLDIFKNLINNFATKFDQNVQKFNLFPLFDQSLINLDIINENVLQLGIISQQFDGSLQLSHRIFTDFILAQYLIQNIYNLDRCVNIEEAELRLDLLNHFVRTYDHNDGFVVRFIKDYLKIEADQLENAKNSSNYSKFEINEQSNLIMNIYEQYFNKSEMRDIFTNSSDFFLYFAAFSDPEICEQLSVTLQILFLVDEDKLQNFLDRKNPTCAKILQNLPKTIKIFKENLINENVAMGSSGFYLTSDTLRIKIANSYTKGFLRFG
ncbi:uncharacterized protein PF3D7_1120600-like [Chironomus tepperi]|uniref:uncharacterized protein PF3D7_1120600-like n=1 Tax=Chironomus tepperi TaxID=113505 RepID=UPI00391F8D20